MRGQQKKSLELVESLTSFRIFHADGNEPCTWETLNDGSVLFLTGIFVDKIAEVGQAVSEENWGDVSDDEIIDMILAWEEMLARFVEWHDTHAWGSSWGNAFFRTMPGDLIMGEFPSAELRIRTTATSSISANLNGIMASTYRSTIQ